MTQWAAFIDESGLFEPAGGTWLPGARLVAGVLLPLPPQEAEVRSAQVLRAALEEIGLGWWSEPVHGSEWAHPPALAKRLLDSTSAPADLRELAGQVESAPGPLKVVGQLAHLGTGPVTLGVLVASRRAVVPRHLSSWSQRLGALGKPGARVDLEVREEAAASSAGLQVADLLAHGLGPGATQSVPPSAAAIQGHGAAQLAIRVRQRFGPGLRYRERDALLDYRLTNRATLALGKEGAFERVAAEARALPPPVLPPGHFPASLEACATAVPALRGLWA